MAKHALVTAGVLSGIIFMNRNGLCWRDAPWGYGPHKALYNRWGAYAEDAAKAEPRNSD